MPTLNGLRYWWLIPLVEAKLSRSYGRFLLTSVCLKLLCPTTDHNSLQLLSKNSVRRTLSSTFSRRHVIHQFNGQVERFADTLKRIWQKLDDGGTISKALQVFLLTYRSTPNTSLNFQAPAENVWPKTQNCLRLRKSLCSLKVAEQNSWREIQPPGG